MLQEHVIRTRDSVLDTYSKIQKLGQDVQVLKHLIPDAFENKMEEWRQWLDDLFGSL